MHTYCRLKDGRIMILWSDNTDEETCHVYPISQRETFDATFDTCEKINYSDIVIIDTNLWVVENLSQGDKHMTILDDEEDYMANEALHGTPEDEDFIEWSEQDIHDLLLNDCESTIAAMLDTHDKLAAVVAGLCCTLQGKEREDIASVIYDACLTN